MKQGEFREIMIMSKNEIAMPKKEGIQREYAVNGAKLLACGKHKIVGHERKVLLQRQRQLIMELIRC